MNRTLRRIAGLAGAAVAMTSVTMVPARASSLFGSLNTSVSGLDAAEFHLFRPVERGDMVNAYDSMSAKERKAFDTDVKRGMSPNSLLLIRALRQQIVGDEKPVNHPNKLTP